MAGLTLLRVVGNDTLVREEQATLKAMQDRQAAPLMTGLASHLKLCWSAARQARTRITEQMIKAMRQRNGEYEPERLAAIRAQGGSTVYMLLTEVKCRAAESWLRDILLDTGTPPWDMTATPIPEMSPDQTAEVETVLAAQIVKTIQASGVAPTPEEVPQVREMVSQQLRFKLLQEAQNRIDRMKLRIEDQFAQGGWAEAFNDFLTDLVTFPAAFVKGPIIRRQRHLAWSKTDEGLTTVVAGERIAPEYERVSPFNIYPEPGITRINDGYLFEHHEMTRTTLADLIGVPGYDDDAIRAVLAEGGSGSWVNMLGTYSRNEEERKYNAELRPTEMFDALEFWGKVSGRMLRDWGMDEDDIPDVAKEYDTNVWVVGNYVLKATLNYDPLGEKPYSKASFIKNAGAFWGRGIPEVIEDIQNICNAAARALVNNMGISSGPQVEVNLERLPPNEDITKMHPWKIWQVLNDPLGSSAPAIRFNQPTDNSGSLMSAYERFARLADDHSGIPSYISGDVDVRGAGRTASGLSMLMGSAGKGIRQVVMHIDSEIIKPVVYRQFVHNMRYDPDETIKGDAEVIARGAVNLAVKETVNVRRVEFLNATANEFDMGILGKEGRAAILREVARGLQMPVDEVIPSREKLAFTSQSEAAAMAAMPQQPQQGQVLDAAGAPAGGLNLVGNQQAGAA